MYPPLYVRPLSETERCALEQGRHSKEAFTLRRCQVLLASAKGTRPSEIAAPVGCSVQTVRHTIHAFEQQGLTCLTAQSSRPKTAKPIFDQGKRDQLRQLLHAKPRQFGQARSTWTLDLLAQVCWEQGLTQTRVSRTTIESALNAMTIPGVAPKLGLFRPTSSMSSKSGNATVSSPSVKSTRLGFWALWTRSGGVGCVTR